MLTNTAKQVNLKDLKEAASKKKGFHIDGHCGRLHKDILHQSQGMLCGVT